MSRRQTDDVEKDINKLRSALKRPKTIPQLIDLLNVDRSTVYRWMHRLEQSGETIARVGISNPVRFVIV